MRLIVLCLSLIIYQSYFEKANAQFNTITMDSNNYKVESTQEREENLDGTEAPYATLSGYEEIKNRLFQEYMSVSYPLKDIFITSFYGLREDPLSHKTKKHNGLDLRASTEEVYSMLAGRVIKTGSDKRSGLYVIIRHGDYTISYCHLSLVMVQQNQELKAGEMVALSGNTGRSTGPHLHITCKFKGKYIDPLIVLDYIKRVRSEIKEKLLNSIELEASL